MRRLLSAFLISSSITALGDARAGTMQEALPTPLPRTSEEQARVATVTAPTRDFLAPEPFESRPAGAATWQGTPDKDSFSQPSENMSFERQLDFKLGNALFEKLWVSSPSSTKASDGLGPLYNQRSCLGCHVRDGRGFAPSDAGDPGMLLMRVAVPAPVATSLARITDYVGSGPEPTYGGQLQDKGLAGHVAEHHLRVTWQELPVPLADGTVVTLRKPTYHSDNPGYGPFADNAQFSPRMAPNMIGLGLLEAIPAQDILSRVDEDDRDANGISGRANMVWSAARDSVLLGRFGLKSGSATVEDQSSSAFLSDIGISTPLHPFAWGDCTANQHNCRGAPHGDADERVFEIDQTGMDLVTFYSRNLAVPARRNVDDPQVLRGKAVFYDIGCTGCHTPKFVTHRLPDQPEQSFQLIWPYSDLLLHDMGPGLADGFAEGRATGREWRTAPLWGIGLVQTVSPQAGFLHDGRARTLLEAVLWHGGEAEQSRQEVVALPAEDRNALIRFLESL
ncbi:MAG: thiol oxidoreductase [Rhodobacteraceae bacterium]|nr:thiol oxidoreductase [Paracoccaceae bacterium]